MHQRARTTPDHMRHRGIHQGEPQRHEPQRRRKLHAFGKCTGNQRRGNDREGHLEGHEHALRNIPHQALRGHARQEGPAQAADKAVEGHLPFDHAGAVDHHAVAIDHPQHADQAGDAEALGEQRKHVSCANQAAVEQGETR